MEELLDLLPWLDDEFTLYEPPGPTPGSMIDPTAAPFLEFKTPAPYVLPVPRKAVATLTAAVHETFEEWYTVPTDDMISNASTVTPIDCETFPTISFSATTGDLWELPYTTSPPTRTYRVEFLSADSDPVLIKCGSRLTVDWAWEPA